MKKYLKDFIKRGLLFANGGPIIYGIVMLILHLCNIDTTSSGLNIFKAILSVSIMAFIIAGISVVYQIEKIGLAFATLIHAITLFICYLVVYLINNWIEKSKEALLIFTLIFIIGYVIIWFIIYISAKIKAKKFNTSLKNKTTKN